MEDTNPTVTGGKQRENFRILEEKIHLFKCERTEENAEFNSS